MLDVEDLTREFTRRGRAFAAVDHVSMHVGAGEFVAIVGRSGNGKSTLINLICGLLRPTSGMVRLDGRDLRTMGERETARMRNRLIGFVTQSQTLLPNLTVLDNVILPAVLGGGPADTPHDDDHAPMEREQKREHEREAHQRQEAATAIPGLPDVIDAGVSARDTAATPPDPLERRARMLLETLEVADLAACYPKELSGGEMRRVSIARALMNRPKLLVADEPTGDLDAQNTALVMRLLREVADAGTAVLMVTHDPDALAYADRVLRMDRGVLSEA